MTLLTGRPETPGRRPAVVLLHERYGIVQHTRDLAEKLAADGFVACVPDLFHRFDGDRSSVERGDIRVELEDGESLADLDAVLAFLRRQTDVVGDEIGLIGVCQTGRQPLLFAGCRDGVASIAVMYGGIGKNDWVPNEGRPSVATFIQALSCPVLGLFGEADHLISVDDVRRFRTELEQADKSYRIRVFRDAPHGWLNDTMPGRYRPEAANAAWAELTSFMHATLGGAWGRGRIMSEFESDVSPEYDFSKNRRMA